MQAVPGAMRVQLYALLSVVLLLIAGLYARPALTQTVQEGAVEDNAQRSGSDVFQQACFTCHGTGFYDAPVMGDVYAWEERLLKPESELLENTLQGFNSMPARGGCADCSAAEVEAAVRFLVQQSKP